MKLPTGIPSFDLPQEADVIGRNIQITKHYAILYQLNPKLHKWCGMAAFASFHVGNRMQRINWDEAGIRSFSESCNKIKRSLEDNFQIIRIINNQIFQELGWMHLAFHHMNYDDFNKLLVEKEKHQLIIRAFDKLNQVRELLVASPNDPSIDELIWKANEQILWHEQVMVVQPYFDQLSTFFSGAMSFFASFDYKVNHSKTRRAYQSRFIFFMLMKGIRNFQLTYFLPDITNLDHRWDWISNDILKKWKNTDDRLIANEIEYLLNFNSI